MNLIEHLLTQLSEEAAEIQIDASKSLRFGLEDRNVLNPTGPTNRERLVEELNDFMAMVKLCEENNIIPRHWRNPHAQEAKIEKVYKFLLYASSQGTLAPDGPLLRGVQP